MEGTAAASELTEATCENARGQEKFGKIRKERGENLKQGKLIFHLAIIRFDAAQQSHIREFTQTPINRRSTYRFKTSAFEGINQILRRERTMARHDKLSNTTQLIGNGNATSAALIILTERIEENAKWISECNHILPLFRAVYLGVRMSGNVFIVEQVCSHILPPSSRRCNLHVGSSPNRQFTKWDWLRAKLDWDTDLRRMSRCLSHFVNGLFGQ